jgi:bifunctional N-acetylglucosamine-1-phosphate-uridyltransferase/glucosamine-1-phosphate-acetyltransferase GlmU-like protein
MFGIIRVKMRIKRTMDIAAIILAAGQGTRLKSALPKPLHRIGGRPMLAWSLDAATAANAGAHYHRVTTPV